MATAKPAADLKPQDGSEENDERHFVTLKSSANKRRAGIRFPKDQEVRVDTRELDKDQIRALGEDPDIRPVR